MSTRRESRVYVGVLPSERPAFERVASAMGLDVSGAVRAVILQRDRELARETGRGEATKQARDAGGEGK